MKKIITKSRWDRLAAEIRDQTHIDFEWEMHMLLWRELAIHAERLAEMIIDQLEED